MSLVCRKTGKRRKSDGPYVGKPFYLIFYICFSRIPEMADLR